MKKVIFVLICVTVITAILFFLKIVINNKAEPITSFLVTPTPIPVEATPTLTPVVSPRAALEKIVNEALQGIHGSYGIVIKNVKTGESYFLNEHQTYEPGSLYKLWVMAAAFRQIEAGKLREKDVLSQDIQVLNSEFQIDPENAERTKGNITLTVSKAIELMIEYSDNYAALLLAERIKNSYIQKYLNDMEFTESSLGQPPHTTPYDIDLFLEKLYNGQLANQENTQKMIETLKGQKLNNKLPKYLPTGTVIGHKTGEIGYFTHDAGIVFSGKGDYFIVIMSQSDAPVAAEERIAEISKAVFDYFNKI